MDALHSWIIGQRDLVPREPDPTLGSWTQELAIRSVSLRSGKRAAAIISLIQSERLNGHDPYASL